MAAYNRGQSGGTGRRNMYSRSAVSSSHYSQNSREDKAPETVASIETAENIETAEKKPTEKQMQNQLGRLAEEIFGSALDTDKLLVAALILLLLKEGADPKLILALGYIFM